MEKPNGLDDLAHVLRNSIIALHQSMKAMELELKHMRKAVKKYEKERGETEDD
jgi:hypothetical protein